MAVLTGNTSLHVYQKVCDV